MFKYLFILCAACLVILSCEKSTEPKETITAPTFSPAGGTYLSAQTVQINCSVANATIRYTIDGTEPTTDSNIYTSALLINENRTIKAKAYKAKMNPSAIVTSSYSFDVGTIYLNPAGGTYNTPQPVQILTSSTGTVVHYTLDGTEPTELSPLYGTPITIESNTVLKAKGFISGWNPSATVSSTYTFNVSQPTFSVAEGTYYNSFELSMNTPTPGASIRYTTDNSEPIETSLQYTAPVTIAASSVIKAKAFKPNCVPSSCQTAGYTLKVTAPQFNPLPGTYYTTQSVTISCPTPDADIFYTIDGSEPTTSSPAYNYPIDISVITSLKARAFRSGWQESNIASGVYNMTVAMPTFTPEAGTFTGAQTITISCATPEAEIRYTLDNTQPGTNSALYTEPVNVATNTTLKAKAYKSNLNSSAIATASYTIIPIQTVAAPLFNPVGGTYDSSQSVSMSCSTIGASIRFTTDNSEPNSSSTIYTGSVNVSSTTTLKAKGFRYGWNDSPTTSATYNINLLPDHMVYIEGGTFNMGCTTVSGDADEYPVHEVTLSPFLLSEHELTQGEYIAITDTNPSQFPNGLSYPVDNVSFYDAIAYCNLRSVAELLSPCYEYIGYGTDISEWPIDWNTSSHYNIICHFDVNGYRLPTEAEWEFAAKGGISTHNYEYAGSDNIDEVAWYGENSNGQSQIVETKNPNELNLYDMSGNIWEIVWDWYGFYSDEQQFNPEGPATGLFRVFRGGMWYADASYSRVSNRSFTAPTSIASTYGFRVAKSVIGASKKRK
jgi:formylglycine-generating enzyme required for sulfatase activity